MSFVFGAVALSLVSSVSAADPSGSTTISPPNVVNISNQNVTASYSGFNFSRTQGGPVTVLPTKAPVTVGTDVVSLGTGGALVIDSSTTSLLLNTSVTTSSSANPSTSSKESSSGSQSSSASRNQTVTSSSNTASGSASSSSVSVTASRNATTSGSSTSGISSSSSLSASRNTTSPVSSSSGGTSPSGSGTVSTTSSSVSVTSSGNSTSISSSRSSSASSGSSSPSNTASSSSSRGSSSSGPSSSRSTSSSASPGQTSTSNSVTSTRPPNTVTSSSSSSDGPTPVITTYSSYPTGFTATHITTGQTTDGHTTSTDSDGHTTIIPIIGGPKCWFCPPGSSGGLSLPKLPFPGVFPPPPGPPGFSISANAPSITIDKNGDPTYSAEPSATPSNTPSSSGSSSSSSCTKSVTASACSTTLIFSEDTDKSVTATSTTTKCSTTTACDAKDSTTTVSTTTTASGGSCPRLTIPTGVLTQPDEDSGSEDGGGDSGISSDNDPNDENAKRSVLKSGHRSFVARNEPHMLEKRGKPKPWLGPDQCGWKTPAPPYVSKKISNIKGPSYPNAEELSKVGPGGSPGGPAYMWLTTIKGEKSSDDTCGLPWDIKTVGNGDVLSTKDAREQTYKWDTGSEDGGAYVNADHVYELKILKDFFTDDAPDYSKDKSGCDGWRKFWVNETNSETSKYTDEFSRSFFDGGADWSRMQTLFKLLPGSANPAWADFAGMDKNVNRYKGSMLIRGLGDIKNDADKSTVQDWIMQLNLMGLAQKTLHLTDVASKFKTTNARIYGAFQQIEGISGCSTPPKDKYASRYSAWMENHLKTQGQQVTDAVHSIITTQLPASKLTTTLTDDTGKSTGEDTKAVDMLKAVTEAFPVDKMTYDTDALLTFPANPAASQGITIKKRQAACTPTATPTASSSSSASKSSGSASASETKSSSAPPTTSSKQSTTPPPTTTKPSSSSVTGFTVTLSAGGSEPSTACDPGDKCDHVACALAGTTASCVTDNQTGKKHCMCYAAIGK